MSAETTIRETYGLHLLLHFLSLAICLYHGYPILGFFTILPKYGLCCKITLGKLKTVKLITYWDQWNNIIEI